MLEIRFSNVDIQAEMQICKHLGMIRWSEIESLLDSFLVLQLFRLRFCRRSSPELLCARRWQSLYSVLNTRFFLLRRNLIEKYTEHLWHIAWSKPGWFAAKVEDTKTARDLIQSPLPVTRNSLTYLDLLASSKHDLASHVYCHWSFSGNGLSTIRHSYQSPSSLFEMA